MFIVYSLYQDRAAKFVDKLSAIGGTMGLLTGFSLISGVEILYFLVKILYKTVKEKLEKKFGKIIIQDLITMMSSIIKKL